MIADNERQTSATCSFVTHTRVVYTQHNEFQHPLTQVTVAARHISNTKLSAVARRIKENRTFIVLSAPPVINLAPVISNVEQNTPASASSEPG